MSNCQVELKMLDFVTFEKPFYLILKLTNLSYIVW